MQVLARSWEITRTLPQADILEHRTMSHCPFMGGCGAHRVEQIAARNTGQAAEGHRRIRHTERGQAHSRQGDVELFGDNGHGIEIRRLALIGGHASGGIALHMFDGLKAFASCEREIFSRDIVLPIDK